MENEAFVGAFRAWLSAQPLHGVAECRAQLAVLRALRGVLDAHEIHIARRLDTLAAPVDDEVAAATKSSAVRSSRVRRRRRVCDDVPELADALAEGATTGDRVDTVAAALGTLEPTDRDALARHGGAIARAASELTDREFRDWLAQLVRRVRTDDGRTRLARQKAAARARWWTDTDGMWNLHSRLDPESGARLQGRLRRITEHLHATGCAKGVEGVPDDPLERQHWLQAHALTHAITGHPHNSGDHQDASDVRMPAGGGVDITVIIDADTLTHGEHPHTRCDINGTNTFTLPIDTIRRWACNADITPIAVAADRNGDRTRLLLGRTTRLANRAQRRALAVWYRTCALCDTPFAHCDIHHLHPWEHGGATNLDNLIPLCNRHHHTAHEGGWQLTLQPDRTLTVHHPDGTTHQHPPPLARTG